MKKTDSPPGTSSSSVLRPHGGDRAGHLCNSQGGCSTAVPPAPAYSRVSRCIFPPPQFNLLHSQPYDLNSKLKYRFLWSLLPPLNETQNPLRKSQTDFRLSAGGWGCTERGQNCSLLPNPTRMQYWRLIHLCSLQGASDVPLQITVLPMSCPNHHSNSSKMGYHVLNLVLQYIFSLFSFFN